MIVGSFAVLGYYGFEIYRKAPPRPQKVVTENGKTVYTGKQIKDGQNVWQSMGGQEVGTVWGHGAYVAPDWSADWLHRESKYMLNQYAQKDFNKPFDSLSNEHRAMLKARLQEEIRKNTYNPETGVLTISPLRAEAIKHISKHYTGLFSDDTSKAKNI